jgi:colanic acid/amylovoran biosynthesis glycosyltransferase
MIHKQLRIAFIVGRFPSLSETFILNQITGLLDAGHHVDIFSYRTSDDSKVQPEVDQYRLMERTTYFKAPASKRKRVWRGLKLFLRYIFQQPSLVLRSVNVFKYKREALSLRQLFLIRPFLRRKPYDILHCHFGTIGNMGLHLKKLGVPGKLVVTFHGYDISQVLANEGPGFYKELFSWADLLMPISDYWEAKLREIGAAPHKIRKHRMGIDMRRFTFHPRQLPAGEQVRLITVGRLVEKKGISDSIRAVSEVCRRNPGLGIRYDVIGEGPLCGELKALVDELEIGEHVYLLGSTTLDDVHQRILESHLFLLPSVTDSQGDQEGIPVSLMEAMATGMPILSTYHTGIPELVQDGISGYLVEEGDVLALADKLEYLILHPGVWAEMGSNGHAFVKEFHDVQKLNQQLIEVYQSMLEEPEENLEILTHRPV